MRLMTTTPIYWRYEFVNEISWIVKKQLIDVRLIMALIAETILYVGN
jgi:hypothetical protein